VSVLFTFHISNVIIFSSLPFIKEPDMRKSLGFFLAAASILPQTVGQTKKAVPDGLCLAEDKPHEVYVATKDTRRWVIPLKPGDVYDQVAIDAVVVYRAAGKKEGYGMIHLDSHEIEKEMVPKLAKYRQACGIKPVATTPK
jgi:hypothetical protein